MKRENDYSADPAVSAAYRAAATERAPEHLDRAVLKEAAMTAATGSKIRARWFRPLAFAATVGLSLAVVLEISQSPEFNAPADRAAERLAPGPESAGTDDRSEMDEQTEDRQVAPMAGGNDAPTLQMPAAKQRQAEQGAMTLQPEPAGRRDVKKESDAFAAAAEQARERVQLEQERVQMDEEKASVTSAQPSESPSMGLSTEYYALPPAFADPDATQSICVRPDDSDPEVWLECIRALQEEGRAEEAAAEMLRFKTAYPDHLPAQ